KSFCTTFILLPEILDHMVAGFVEVVFNVDNEAILFASSAAAFLSSAKGVSCMAGRRLSHTRSNSSCVAVAEDVSTTTASFSGITIINCPPNPSALNALFLQIQN